MDRSSIDLPSRLLLNLESWRNASHWRIAFSGGLDSTVLLHLLANLAFQTLTRLVGHSVQDAAYEAVRRHFSEEEVTFLSVSIATINAWNRLGAGLLPPLP